MNHPVGPITIAGSLLPPARKLMSNPSISYCLTTSSSIVSLTSSPTMAGELGADAEVGALQRSGGGNPACGL